MVFENIQASVSDRYILGKMIAKGGMAEIYIAKKIGAEDFYKICAIKRILPQYAQEEEFLQMFRAEADICKRLQHTNIVQVMDFTTISGSYGIVMEYVDGVDLRAILAACEQAGVKLTVPMVLYITSMIARGLHYTHIKKDDLTGKPLDLIHRDVSPQNILIGFEGDVKLTDFGIAHFESKSVETQPGVVKGKYAYMSPEQVKGLKLDYQTDVYSLAVVMWEALAMKRLFCGETEIDTIKNVQECKIRYNLRDLNSSVDQELYEIIMKELSVDKDKRFSSAASFEKALLKYLYTYYPDFTVIELSNFLKKLLARKRLENQELIKSLAMVKASCFQDTKGVKTSPSRKKDGSDSDEESEGGLKHVAKDLFAASKQVILKKASNPLNIGYGLSVGSSTARSSGFGSSNVSYLSGSSRVGSSSSSVLSSSHAGYSRSPRYNRGDVQVARYKRVSSRKNYSIIVPFLLLLTIFSGLFYVLNHKHQFMAFTSTFEIQLSSIPSDVRIKVGNTYLNKGNLIRTPAKLTLRGDRSEIIVEREGYISKPLLVKSDSNSVNVILTREKKDSGIIDINVKQKKKIYVEYDRIVKRYTPVSLLNVGLGNTHSIVIYPSYPNKSLFFKCDFVLKDLRNELLIDLENKSCSLSKK